MEALYSLAADAILVVHALFVGFLVFGLLFIYAGGLLSWRWVRNPWFRIAHLFGIGVVVVQSWLGVTCPLTTWEMMLRGKAGQTAYGGSFIAHWLNEILYYQAPAWVFITIYSLFGTLVLLSWYMVRPARFGERSN